LIVATPILRPVNEPGPQVRAKRSISEMSRPEEPRCSEMDGRSHAACGPADPTLHSEMSVLSSRRAIEPEAEEVSIASIFSVHLVICPGPGRTELSKRPYLRLDILLLTA